MNLMDDSRVTAVLSGFAQAPSRVRSRAGLLGIALLALAVCAPGWAATRTRIGLRTAGAAPPQTVEKLVQLKRIGGFSSPRSVSVNWRDGSCYVADTGNDQVVHLARNGSELWRATGFSFPTAVAANIRDGSCWVADWTRYQIEGVEYGYGAATHLTEHGKQLTQSTGLMGPWGISVNPADSSVWVANTDNYCIVHFAEDGGELWRGGYSLSYTGVSANLADGSCWAAAGGEVPMGVAHFAGDGTLLWQGHWELAWSVAVNPADGSAWVLDWTGLWHLAEDGTETLVLGEMSIPGSVSVNPRDGSVWVASGGRVLHVAADGSVLWESGGFSQPFSISVNPLDGSVWVADTGNNQVVHLKVRPRRPA